MTVSSLVERIGSIGFQGTEIGKAVDTILKMKKSGSKIFLTFTSNMVTSGLRGLFAQLIKLKLVDVVITTVGSIEEDIMRAKGESFLISSFHSDDLSLHERGMNRVGNILVPNESYCKLEDELNVMLDDIYKKQAKFAISELLRELGSKLNDEDSILYQAYKNKIPVFCPAITDGAFGFHLYLFQQKHPDFFVDIVKDFENILFVTGFDEKKGLIALGGGVSKHHALLANLLNGGLDYAVYITTEHPSSGSMSGATTQEAKSWGKIKDDSDAATIHGEVSVMFPLVIFRVLEELNREGLLNG
ncbi:MAG: deoxyhypusine synthase family protein [Candidatus Nanoarchaeia archaeon]|nr:deoxyhypusine synthase family protein [Candidatus Nanoarchaeia archaeon]